MRILVTGSSGHLGEALVRVLRADGEDPVGLEQDDREEVRTAYDPVNLQAVELLHRRVDLADVVSAHRRAIERGPDIGFGRYIVSATSPFAPDDVGVLGTDAAAALRRHHPEFEADFASLGWRLPARLDRVYVNQRARQELGWEPQHDFATAVAAARSGRPMTSDLARQVGAKGYHPTSFGVYTQR